ncbi:hypothetical protein EZV62_014195 [Acer yangbiense]|uniref:F-box protein At3g26010-like beta-propeller domain-containing protein n=1 Tax=Acer yangbiense TaxID=1000413 RepID=A0A5C7HTU1_9ROSI|nr:hypothetical protein EZV62_014195 [Acer yangbiense]
MLPNQARSLFLEPKRTYSLLNPKQEKQKRNPKQNHQYPFLFLASQVSSSCRLKMKKFSSIFRWNNSDGNSDSDSKEYLLAKTAEEDNNFVDSDFEEDHLSPKTSEEDSSWVGILGPNVDSDSQEDLSAKTSDDETSWVNVTDHNVDSDFQEDDHLTDFGLKEDLPPPPEFNISGFFDLPDKSPGVLHESDTQSPQILELKEDKRYAELSYVESPGVLHESDTQSPQILELKEDKRYARLSYVESPGVLHESDTQSPQILELKENKRYAELSYVEGGTHSCNFVGQISKKLKFKDNNECLKDVIKWHALPFLPAKSLCRFRSVCKDWDERISHPFLAHQQTNQFKDISGLLCQSPFLAPSFVNFDRDAYGIPSPCFSFLPDLVNVKSTCNGLVCCQCSCEVDVYYVCNPVTEKWTKLPQPNMLHESQTVATLAFEPTAFGFAAHYQLVCAVADVLSDPPVVYFEIYSSRTNTWRVSETVCYEADALTLSNDGFYVNGNVYWKTLSGAILTFHLHYELYSIVQLPPNHGPQGALTHLHGELCYVLPAIVDNECIISIYGTFDMSLKYEISLLQNMSGMYCQALPSVNDEMLMILLDEGVITYHVKTEKVEFLSEKRMEGYQTILPYINTLVGIATPSSKELETGILEFSG